MTQLKHGHNTRANRQSPTYVSWGQMIQRCTNPKRTRWAEYGGRGIAICERWKDFRNFLADMGERPEGTSIDRIDNKGNYEPGNCKWSTPKEQAANQSHNPKRKLTELQVRDIRARSDRGELKVSLAAEEFGVDPKTIRDILCFKVWRKA